MLNATNQPTHPPNCATGYMPCPYNANNNGYTWCQCPQLGPPFGLCVADSYYCGYYCQYAPSWIFTAIAKGAMLCPIDPAQIDPYKPDVIYPGWVSSSGLLWRMAALCCVLWRALCCVLWRAVRL